MKVSSSLLKAILVGVTLGTATSSCTTLKEKNEVERACDERCAESCDGKHTYHSNDCGPCGMG